MASKLGDIFVDLRMETKNLQKDVSKATKEMDKINRSAQKTAKSTQTLNKSIIRHVRGLETLYVAYKSVKTIMTGVIGEGLKLNSMYEDQALGIAALTSAKVDMFDASGKELNAYDKFVASQQMTLSLMDDIREASLKTPASMGQMVGFYQQTIGHAITSNNTFGKSMEDVNANVILFTQRMSSLGMSVGMDMTKLNEELRSLMSGNASTDSLLASILFGSPAAANQAVKKAKKSQGGLSTLFLDILKPFENVEGVMTYSKAMAQLSAQFDDLRRFGTQTLFEDITQSAEDLMNYLKTNMVSLSRIMDDLYVDWKSNTLTLSDAWGGVFESLGGIVALVKEGYENIGAMLTGVIDVDEGFSGWEKTLVVIEKTLNGIALVVNLVTLGLNRSQQLAVQGLQLVGYYDKDLTGAQEKSLSFAERNAKRYEEGTKQYERHMATIERLTAIKEGEAEATRITNALAKEEKDIRSKIDKNMDRGSDKDRDTFLVEQNRSLRERAVLLRDVKKATTEQEVAQKSLIAMENANGDTDTLKKIGDVASKQLEAIATAKRVVDIRAKIVESTKDATKAAKGHNKALKDNLALQLKLAELAKAKLDLEDAQLGKLITRRELLEREVVLAKKKVEIDKKALADAKKTAKEVGIGIGADKARKKVVETEIKLVKSQTAMWKKINKELLDTASSFKSIIESSFDSILKGDFGGAFNNMFDGLITELMKPMKDELSTMFGNMMGGSDGLLSGLGVGYSAMIGAGLAIVGDLFSNTLSDAEIEDARGITEVQSDSIENILETLNKTNTKELVYSKGIYENMRALVESSNKASVQLGNEFNPADSSGSSFLGFSTSTITNLASGLEINATSVDDLRKELVNARQYQTDRIQKSSFWGLISTDKLKTTYEDLDNEVMKSLAEGYVSGLEAIRDAGNALGVQTIDTLLEGFTTGTHDLNFKDKSQEEISAMISGAMSKDFDAFIEATMPFIIQYQKIGEDLLETVVRVAFEFESVQNALDKLGGSLSAFGSNAIEVSQTLVDASGGLDEFLGNVAGFIDNFYTDVEKQQLRYDTIMKTTGVLPADMDAYKALVNTYVDLASSGSVSGAEKLADLLDMQQTYYEYYDYILEEEKRLADEKQKLLEEELTQAQKNYDFYKSIYDKIVDAYTGSLSYLNSVEKASYLDRVAQQQFESGDTQSYIDTLYKQLEYEKKISLTKEDYADKFEDYVGELKSQEPEADVDDVVEGLDRIYEKLGEVSDAITSASYQN